MENATRKFAVVTGASSGIGLELAQQFAEHGFDLLITATSDLTDVAASLATQGVRVQTYLADLRRYDEVEKLYEAICATGRAVDAIAINAGVGVGGDFTDTSLEAELDMIQLNVISTVHLTKRIAKDMADRGSGKILITSSVVGIMPAPYQAVYGATKAFDLMFAEAIRSELKNSGVTVTALMPGATNTDFFRRAGLLDTKVGAEGKMENDPGLVARQGFEALMAGKDHIVAGSFKTKLQALVSRLLPEPVRAESLRGQSKPGSAKHV